jgi:hypothetical protein
LDLSGLDAFVKTSGFRYLTTPQKAALNAVGQPMVDVSSLDRLWDHIDRPIHVSVGNAKINVAPRRKQDRRLLHLVNMVPGSAHEDFTMTLSKQFTGAIGAATLYSPGRQAITLRCRAGGGFTEISVPHLKEWGIVTLLYNRPEDTNTP